MRQHFGRAFLTFAGLLLRKSRRIKPNLIHGINENDASAGRLAGFSHLRFCLLFVG
jgi:hypothetical protein